jgi:hypothetical protein
MKKIVTSFILLFTTTCSFAQDLTSKKGETFLPDSADYALSLDATPFLNYLGNMFGKTANNTAPNWTYITNNMSIMGKKFINSKTAYRATVRVGFSNYTNKQQTMDRAAAQSTVVVYFPSLPASVENKHKHSSSNVGISIGMEKRRGKTRLQGIYGAEFGFGFSSTKDKYSYGNALNVTAPTYVAVDSYTTGPGTAAQYYDGFNETAVMTGTAITGYKYDNIIKDTYGNDARITTYKSGVNFEIGARAFVGAEYFIAPKISLAGEFGWGAGVGIQGKSKTTIESVDRGVNTQSGVPTIGTQELTGSNSSGFYIDTDNANSMFGPSGTLRLNLHF